MATAAEIFADEMESKSRVLGVAPHSLVGNFRLRPGGSWAALLGGLAGLAGRM